MIMSSEPAFCHRLRLLISFVVPTRSDVKSQGNSTNMNFNFILCVTICFVIGIEAQLDLPRVQSSNAPRESQDGPEVLVLPNSYANEKGDDVQTKSDSNYRFDSDRSQRFGKILK